MVGYKVALLRYSGCIVSVCPPPPAPSPAPFHILPPRLTFIPHSIKNKRRNNQRNRHNEAELHIINPAASNRVVVLTAHCYGGQGGGEVEQDEEEREEGGGGGHGCV